jgi:hypothetical protein
MNLFGAPKEKRTQLYFRDDAKFLFRKQDIIDTFLVDKKDNAIVNGWKHFFKNQFPFAGFKNIPADMVTISFARDIIFDPYNLVSKQERPENWGQSKTDLKKEGTEKNSIQSWLVDVGHARRLKMIAKRAKSSSYDRLVVFLGAGFVIEIIVIGIIYAISRGH